MKFLHTADLHLGQKLSSEFSKEVKERLELDEKSLLSNIINCAEENNIPYIFIAGDLFDTNKPKAGLVSFVMSEFERYQGKVFITPGNHDYFSEESVYATTTFPENVHIFTDEITMVEEEDAYIYGYGFSAPHKNEDSFSGFKAEGEDKPRILITHTDFNTNSLYNPINIAFIGNSNLSYIAAGHIHIREEMFKKGNTYVSYSGAPQNLRFKETGKAEVLIIDLASDFLTMREVDLSLHSYKNVVCDISSAETESEFIKICADALSLSNPLNSLINLKITGSLKDGIITDFTPVYEKLSGLCLYLRTEEDFTKRYDIDLIKEENSVRGEFVRQVLENYEEPDFINRIIEKGMKYL